MQKKKKRVGFLAIKLTKEALNYQVENYDEITGLSSMRGKASLAYIIMYLWGLSGVINSLIDNIIFFYFILGIIIAITIYYVTKVGIIIVLVIVLLNAFFGLIADPTRILSALIVFYLSAYFLYPAYQVEKNRKHKGKIKT